jgi:hypothetical protein
MKQIILSLLFPFIFLPQGTYRWDVKVCIDTAGQRIFKKKSVGTSVSELASKKENPRPEKEEIKKVLRAQSEKRKVTVTAYVIGMGLEKDGDYHLILKALKSKTTLVAEIPNPDDKKLKKFPELKKKYQKARDEIDNKIGVPGKSIKETDPVKVIVTGIVFFDIFEEGGHGHGSALENAIEIHPVTVIKVLK